MSNKQKNILTIVAGLVIVCIFGIVIVYIVDQQKQEELRNTFGEDIIALCAEDHTNMQRGSVPASSVKLLVLSGPRRSTHHNGLPENMQAKTRDELTIVACEGDDREELLERCEYEGNVSVERYVQVTEFTLYNAKTKSLITSFEVRGSLPAACEDEVRADENEVQKERGDSPDDEAFMLAFNQAIRQ